MPRVSEKRRLIQWYQKSIDAYKEQKTIEMLQEALEDSDMDWLDDSSITSQCLSTTFAWTSSSSSWSTTDSLSSSDDSMKSIETTFTEMEDEDILLQFTLLMHLQNIRYLKPRLQIPKSQEFYEEILPNLPENRFIQFFRMSREGFQYVLSKIQHNIIFNNNSNYQQVSVSKQLAVALRRLCTESSVAGSCINVAQTFGIAEGTVVLYTKRVIQALMDIWVETVRWHTTDEKKKMKLRMINDKYSHGWELWEDCIGIVDGTFIPFARRPFPQDRAIYYWSHRKKKYGLQATIICDDTRRILVFHSRFPGGCHDSRAFKSLELTNYPTRYFKQHEYIIGDAAYQLTHRLIVPFRRSGGLIASDKARFNTSLSKLRVRVEHTIGMLKARFAFLRCIPNTGNLSAEQLNWIYGWMGASVIIHNLLRDCNDIWEPTIYQESNEELEEIEESGEEDREEGYNEEDEHFNQRGQAKRQALLEEFLTREEDSCN